MESLAITDYGNIFGAVQFFVAAKKAGIKPILGCELFIPSYDDHKLRQYRRGQDHYWQVIFLVQNQTGYKNLARMMTQAYLDGFYYKPRVDSTLMREFGEGLLVLSSGFNSEINHHLHNEDSAQALLAAQKYAKLFPDRFYIELQDNGLPGQNEMNQELKRIAQEVGVPCVATGNVHYLDRSDADAFEVLRGIQMGRTIFSPYDQLKFSTDAYHFASPDEMTTLFNDSPEALSATKTIAARCDFDFTYGIYHLPKYETPAGKTLDNFMAEEARAGLKSLWSHIKMVSHVTDEDWPRYHDRLETEIGMICQMGFAGYFLIVSDFITWAKKQDIPVGPGRGSGAGSLVAFCLNITGLDPLPYNLLFERFLNPERVSLPDFDIDFCQDRRGEVIQYVSQKFGNVSQIITFGKMKAKAVVRDVGRVMELEYDRVDKIAKLIPNELGITLAKALEQEPDLKKLYEEDETVARLLNTSIRLEGLNRHASVHAAGVIITDQPLWNFVPLYKGSSEDVVVQFDMKDSEKIGLVKFDFLGLKTLTVIQNAVKNIKVSCGVQVDINTIPINDSKVFAKLGSGDGGGIFQLESSGMCELMKRLKPSCFEDIIALVALYRPGPMDLIPDFIERKHGRQSVSYLDPRLEPILGPTYGIMVYQEQVMQIAQEIGGYTLGGADLLRRAMGKKIAEEMAKQRDSFVAGAVKNGLDQNRATQLFDMMEKFASYGFNKSHAAAYALVSYQTAWLKTHYPAEYMAAIMTSEMQDTDKLLFFMADAKSHGLEFLPPDINLSSQDFTVESGCIRYALAAIKGVGGAAIEAITEARSRGPFLNLFDFCLRVDLRRVTKKVIEMLIKAGALDGFHLPRKELLTGLENVSDAAVRKQKSEELGQYDLFASMDAETPVPVGISHEATGEWLASELLSFEKEAFGFYFSNHPLTPFAQVITKLTNSRVMELKHKRQDDSVTLGGIVVSHRAITTKKGDRMAFANFEDLTGSVEMILFPKTYREFREILEQGDPVIVKASVDRSQENVKIKAESLSKLSDTLKLGTRSIHLQIPVPELTKQKLDQLLQVLVSHSGQSHVVLHLKQSNEYETILDVPFKAMACESLMDGVGRIFSGRVVQFV